MAFEWVAGLFQSEQTRGLSGDSANTVALDDANPYYNYRLRRHKAEGDVVADPGLLWYTSPYVKRRSGLGTHIGAEVGEGVANYTDVLVILAGDDYERASSDGGTWLKAATRTLQQEFENFCRRESFSRLHPHRQLGFRVLSDGSPEMGGTKLNLPRGEFITGLLPNLYTGPVRGSFPVIGVHLNLPGVWDGYQEIGRLYNDQILFTIGNHWLDNFSHPSLQQAALYRLQQYPDGSFVHIINPDLQDRYQVTSTSQGGASVLTLATRGGQPLAYMVLAVIDAPAAPVSSPPGVRPDIQMPAAPPPASASRPPQAEPAPRRGPTVDEVPAVAPPMLIDDQLQPLPQGDIGGKTIIPDAPSERIFTFQERGALLQKVHFSAFMLGYDVFLGPRGELGTVVEEPAATFQVRKREVSLVAHVHGVVCDGRPVPREQPLVLEGAVSIEVSGQKLEYRDLRGMDVDGWPYVGEIRRPASSTYMIWGEDYQIGRSRECRVVLPDEPRNDNIHWKPSVGDGATIRARTGEIPKSRFYTDSIMVASEHATIDLKQDLPAVVCDARHCYVYVRRQGEVMPLFPSTHDGMHDLPIAPGDEVLIGNCLFHVGFTPAGDAVAPGPAPKIELSADALVDAVDKPDLVELSRDSVPPPPERTAAANRPRDLAAKPEDTPKAFGLGEQGEEPAPVPVEPVGMDSIIGMPVSWEGDGPPPPTEPMNLSAMEEDVGDDPTSPGVTSGTDPGDKPVFDRGSPPSSLFDRAEALDAAEAVASEVSTDDLPEAPEDADDVGGWDAEEWEDEDSSVQSVEGPPEAEEPSENLGVPDPFPDVESTEVPEVAEPPVVHGDAAEDGAVVFTTDSEAQFELGRPMHLILAGWTVNGEVTCGNHSGADSVLPENRIADDQTFTPQDYFRLKVRGRRGHLEVLAPTELLIDEEDPGAARYEDPAAHTIDVIRRDDAGEEDFAVRMELVAEKRLPDPRARLLKLDYDDPLAAALVTRGLPKGQGRTLDLGGVTATLTYDDGRVRVSDFLDTYRCGDGFVPFFVQRGTERFKTAPEDGAAFDLASGDRMVVGNAVYVLREE